MGQIITLNGTGYGISFVEITDQQIESILEEAEEVDEATDIDLVSKLIDESFYEYGLLLNEAELKLEVDEADKSNLLKYLISTRDVAVIDLAKTDGVNWLVYEAKEKVNSTINVDKFDPIKLDFTKHKLTLPNKDIKTIVEIYYDDNGFDPWNNTSVGFVYIVKKDGEIITF